MAEKTDTVPSLTIRRVPIDSLHPDPANARAHPEANLDAIAASLARFEQVEPVLVQAGTNRIVAGHGRIAAMRRLGWESCDVVELPINDLDAASLAIALNRSGELATWDESALATILEGLRREDALDGVGFSSTDIDQLLADLAALQPPKELTDPEIAELPDRPVSRRGDLWVMGDHRLLCGDACEPTDYEKLLQGEIVDVAWNDAPYNVNYTGKTADALQIENDDLTDQEFEQFLRRAFTAMLGVCRPGANWFSCAPSGPQFLPFAVVLAALGIWHQTCIWLKDSFALGHADYHHQYENILVGWKPGAAHRPPRTRDLSTVWEAPKPRANLLHPTMKPIPLITRAIEASSAVGDIVCDCFSGSGSAIIAAESTRRRARAIEIDGRYVDASIRRWQEATGEKAMLGDRSFDEVAAERAHDEKAAG